MRSRVMIVAATFCLTVAVTTANAALTTDPYGGLGAAKSAFYASNPTGAGLPPLGVAYYCVDRIEHGRVLAYHVVINAKPRMGNRVRLFLTEGINLPRDARHVRF